MKKLLYSLIFIFWKTINILSLKTHKIKYKKLYLRGKLYIKRSAKKEGAGVIVLGNRVTINSSRNSNPIGGDFKTTLYTIGSGKIIIGDETGLSNTTIVSNKKVEIGKCCIIGNGTKIYDTDFHSIYYKDRENGNLNIQSKQITIGDHVFIGCNVIILKGVNIGNGSVIGAGSVVTQNIPDNQVWCGNPARFVKDIKQL